MKNIIEYIFFVLQINIEFEMLFPECGNNLINKFPLFTKKILAMSKNSRYRFRKGRVCSYKYIYQDSSKFTDGKNFFLN